MPGDKELRHENFETDIKTAKDILSEMFDFDFEELDYSVDGNSLSFSRELSTNTEGTLPFAEAAEYLKEFKKDLTVRLSNATKKNVSVSLLLDLNETTTIFFITFGNEHETTPSFEKNFSVFLQTSKIGEISEGIAKTLDTKITVTPILDPRGLLLTSDIVVENLIVKLDAILRDYPMIHLTDRSTSTHTIIQLQERNKNNTHSSTPNSIEDVRVPEAVLSAAGTLEKFLTAHEIEYDEYRKGTAMHFDLRYVPEVQSIIGLARTQSGVAVTFNEKTMTLTISPRLN
jgi:hypothetical protein